MFTTTIILPVDGTIFSAGKIIGQWIDFWKYALIPE
jgi:hypothetical protein